MQVIGHKVLIKPTEGEYSISSESGLIVPEGFDLAAAYSEGIVLKAGTRSMCQEGDRVVYVSDRSIQNGDTYFVNDSDIAFYERY